MNHLKTNRQLDRQPASHCTTLGSLADRGLYIHALPGRIRLAAPGLRGDGVRARATWRAITGHAGVNRVEVNPVSGRILVEFDSAVQTADGIVAQLDSIDCFMTSPCAGTSARAMCLAHLAAEAFLRLASEAAAAAAIRSALTLLL